MWQKSPEAHMSPSLGRPFHFWEWISAVLVNLLLENTTTKKNKSRFQLGGVSANPQVDGATTDTEMRKMLQEMLRAGWGGNSEASRG